MKRQIIANRIPGERRIATLEEKKLVEFSVERDSDNRYLGNIYWGTVRRVIPGMQSAFVEFGAERTGFIYVKDLKKDISYEEYQKNIEGEDDGDEEGEQPAGRASITDYIKDGQSILVQVVKEPIGSKGARLTTHVSLPGRFCVLMPTITHTGISRKIQDPKKRSKLRNLGKKVNEKGYGIILRTMAASVDAEIVEREIVSLIKEWDRILTKFKKEKSERLIYEASSPLIESIKNTYSEDLDSIVVDNREDYNSVKDYIDSYLPEKRGILKIYELPYPVFDYYSIEADMEKCFRKKVWMKSGGFLYIEQTEALTVIDVNTGKFLGRENLEKTVLKTNIEAAQEIAYHIRLRNVAGIIIVDFIDMKHRHSRNKVVKILEDALNLDPAKTSVYHFTRLGLVQITRKRTSESNLQIMTQTCPYCSGNGTIKSKETICFDIMRELQRQARLYDNRILKVEAHPEIIFALKNQLEREMKSLSRELKLILNHVENRELHRERYHITTSR